MEDIFHLGIKALLRNDKKQVLLFKVNPLKLRGELKDYWDLPGGRVQVGDSIIDTLRREVEEETGLTAINDPKEVGMVLSNIRIPLGAEKSAGLILNIYTCKLPQNAHVRLSEEHIAYDWFSPSEAAKLLGVKYPESFCRLVAEL